VGRESWLATYAPADADAAALSVDRHNSHAVAFTTIAVVGDRIVSVDLTYGELADRSKRLATALTNLASDPRHGRRRRAIRPPPGRVASAAGSVVVGGDAPLILLYTSGTTGGGGTTTTTVSSPSSASSGRWKAVAQ
jgi:acyl-coenzyme A synthetase/AMP-(fatty) acid ligase